MSAGFLIQLTHAQNAKHVMEHYKGKASFLSNDEIVDFHSNSKTTKAELLSQLKGGSGKSLNTSLSDLKALRSETDELGSTHHVFQQTINGVPVKDCIVKIHEKGGYVNAASIHMESDIKVPTSPTITAAQAKILGLKALGNPIAVDHVSKQNKAPEPELIIIQNDAKSYVLTWMMDVLSVEPFNRRIIYVNAQNGQTERIEEMKHNCSSASVATRHNGNQTINFNPLPLNANYHYLYDNCRPNATNSKIETSSFISLSQINATTYEILYQDISKPTAGTWPSSTNAQKTEYGIHWGVSKAYDYFLAVHNRKSYDNNDGLIQNFAHVNSDPDNAAWLGGWMLFGDGGDYNPNGYTTGPMTCTDIIGHELAHGVTEKSGGLNYQGESGALNEAWSDMFGADFEAYAETSTLTNIYNIGEKVWKTKPLRSMSNPNNSYFSQPDTYQGTHWVDPNSPNDYGGVHTNSGVANYWFYLLSQGGSGTNDIGNAFNVTAITRAKAIKIAYRALSVYFTPTTNFEQARYYTIKAAEDLYGHCSNEATQAAKAWHAVGVGANNILTLFSSNPNNKFCAAKTTYTFSVPNHVGSTYTWGVPSPATISSGAGTSSIVVNFNNSTAGNKTITVTENSTTSCPTASTSKVITVVPIPVLTVAVSSPTCGNSTITYTASGANRYEWLESTSNPVLNAFAGNSVTANTANITVPTNYSQYLNGYSADGCRNSLWFDFTVNPSPNITVSASADPVCEGGSTTLTATGASSYLWSSNTGYLSATSGATTVYTPGGYTYGGASVTGSNSYGCTATVHKGLATMFARPIDKIIGGNSLMYGMTEQGGTSGLGTIFEWNKQTNAYTKKFDFNGTNGSYPDGYLTYFNGKYYGLTTSGGVNDMGVLFEWNASTNTYTKKVDFNGTAKGSNPFGHLIIYNGKLYGMCSSGGTYNLGVIFEWNPSTNTITKKIEFDGTAKGSYPSGSLRIYNNICYGMTTQGGTSDMGVVFTWNPSTNAFTKNVNFNGTNGSYPNGNDLAFYNNKLYGMTFSGGTSDAGTIFEWNPTTSVFTKKYDFSQSSNPSGMLTLHNNKFYGTTQYGSINYTGGTIFEWDPTSNVFTKKANFPGGTLSGSLTMSPNWFETPTFYGLFGAGGANNQGGILEWSLTSSYPTIKQSFNGTNGLIDFGSGLNNNLVEAYSNATVCAGDGITRTYSAYSGYQGQVTYVWTVPTGATILSGQGTGQITVSYAANAVSGNISVYAYNNCWQTNTATYPVTINCTSSGSNPRIANVDANDESTDITLYPNPSSGIFYLNKGELTGTAIIFDVFGREVLRTELEQNNPQSYFDLQNQAKGIYTLKILGTNISRLVDLK